MLLQIFIDNIMIFFQGLRPRGALRRLDGEGRDERRVLPRRPSHQEQRRGAVGGQLEREREIDRERGRDGKREREKHEDRNLGHELQAGAEVPAHRCAGSTRGI